MAQRVELYDHRVSLPCLTPVSRYGMMPLGNRATDNGSYSKLAGRVSHHLSQHFFSNYETSRCCSIHACNRARSNRLAPSIFSEGKPRIFISSYTFGLLNCKIRCTSTMVSNGSSSLAGEMDGSCLRFDMNQSSSSVFGLLLN